MHPLPLRSMGAAKRNISNAIVTQKLSILTHAHGKFADLLLGFSVRRNHWQEKTKKFLVVSILLQMLTAMGLSHCIFGFAMMPNAISPERLLPCESAYMRAILFSKCDHFMRETFKIHNYRFGFFQKNACHDDCITKTIILRPQFKWLSMESFFIGDQRDVYMKSN